MTIADHITHQW